MTLDAALKAQLQLISTATITTVLFKLGIRNVYLRGVRPFSDGLRRMVGAAFTLRFIPAREDVATPESWSSPLSTRAAIEAMPEGCVAVVDAMGIQDAGIWGDILCARMVKRGVAGLVTDGAIRDVCGIRSAGLPVWCTSIAPTPSVCALTFSGWQQPIGCGGVAVFPDDVIVADDDGTVVIPQAIAQKVANSGTDIELLENWILTEVARGCALPGLYPPNEQTKARYEEHARQMPTPT